MLLLERRFNKDVLHYLLSAASFFSLSLFLTLGTPPHVWLFAALFGGWGGPRFCYSRSRLLSRCCFLALYSSRVWSCPSCPRMMSHFGETLGFGISRVLLGGSKIWIPWATEQCTPTSRPSPPRYGFYTTFLLAPKLHALAIQNALIRGPYKMF